MQALRSFFANMTVGARIIALFLSNLLAIIIIAVIAHFSFQNIGAETHQITSQDLPLTAKITAITKNQTEQTIELERALRYAEMGEMYKRNYFSSKEKFSDQSSLASKNITDAISFIKDSLKDTTNEIIINEFHKITKHLETIDEEHEQLHKDVNKIFALIESNKLQSAHSLMPQVEDKSLELNHLVSDVLHEIEKLSLESLEIIEEHSAEANHKILAVSLIAAIIGLLFSHLIKRSIEWNNTIANQKNKLNSTRIMSAINSVTSNVMIADADNIITFMNPALDKMLKDAEKEIQETLFSFKVDEIIGGSVDRFHKNPAHQQGMLKNLTTTYSTAINIGKLVFNLVATPIMDDNGTRLGTVVEWQNSTEMLLAEARSIRIQTSLDCVTSNVMIADANNDIQYMNPSLVKMMTEAEKEIQETLSGFRVDEIIGGSVDRFHKNPAHQQGMLKNLTTTYSTTINVGNLMFDLVASPILDDSGKRLGTVVEWQNVTETRKAEELSIRIQTSLDRVTSNVMLADENNIVIYMNEAVANMLHSAESDIRQALPDFRVDDIIGTSIDKFHKNPAHQRSMLDNLNSTYGTVIKISGRSFSLIANPVLSNSGDRLGTVVEWGDVTAELQVESEVASVVHAATEGDFTKRLGLDGKEGFMLNLAEGINKIGEISHIGLSEVTSVIQELYNGTLTTQIEGDYKGSFEEIKQALNGTITRLNTMVTTIISTAGNVNSASSEISTGSDDLSERTEKQASTLEETAASMEELTGAVRQNTENASDASKLAITAKGVAQKGGDISTKAIEAMSNIETSSQKIADIIGVIDEIAFQTNLLALNAAVEAARAGEAGKGFAVVASEVRSLAGRSASASKEIKDLISDSAKQVKFGSELVNEAGQTLTEIVGSINEVADLMSGIASASEQQSSGIDEINTAVAGMDEMTQQNAALVEENTAAARSLVEQAIELQEMMQFFTVDEGDDDFGIKKKKSSTNPRPAAKAHKPSKPTAKNNKTSPLKSPNTGSNPEHYSDGWEEF